MENIIFVRSSPFEAQDTPPLPIRFSIVEYMKRELQTPVVAIFHFVQARVSPLLWFSVNFRRQQRIMFRSSFVEDTGNPWSPSSTYIHVGSLQNILTFAEKCGHIDRVSL